ncbi:MAG: porin family protein [Acidobacteria bacterium]|nr:porin family protein [Acidobacteriota bacterium]
MGYLIFTFLLVIGGCCVPTAHAQTSSTSGARLSATVGGSFGDGGTTAEVGASAGYRFTPWVGVEFDLAYIPNLTFDRRDIVTIQGLDHIPPPLVASVFPGGLPGIVFPSIFPPINFHETGRILAFTTNFVGEFPTGADRLRVYVLGGGGVANVEHKLAIDIGRPLSIPMGRPTRMATASQTGLALTTGGGVEATIWKGLAVAADVRYLRVFEDVRDVDIARVAARLSYRF